MKPFLQGKKALSSPALHAEHHHRGASHARPPASAPVVAPSPQVELVKQGDKVVRIVITCTCGERVEVNCLYAAGV